MTKELIRLRDLYHEANALYLSLSTRASAETVMFLQGSCLLETYLHTCAAADRARMRRDRRQAAFARAYDADAAKQARRQIFPLCPLVAQAIAEHGAAILTPPYRAKLEQDCPNYAK